MHAAFVLSQHTKKSAAIAAAKKNGATLIIHEPETGRTNERWLTATNATFI